MKKREAAERLEIPAAQENAVRSAQLHHQAGVVGKTGRP